jgi:uncharacterized protein DUF4126
VSDFDLALSIALGIGLAAATGFRMFLPMLVMSAAAYTGHVQLADSFVWLGTPSALTLLGVAALAEILAYYIPGVDNLLDALATPAAFVAGTVVAAAVVTDLPPLVKWSTAIIAGGRRRRPHAKHDRAAQGEIHHLHRRARQPCRRHGGARRRAHPLAAGAGGAVRRARAGHRAVVAGVPHAPADRPTRAAACPLVTTRRSACR